MDGRLFCSLYLAFLIPVIVIGLALRVTKGQKRKGSRRIDVRNVDGILMVGNHVNDRRSPLNGSDGCMVDHADVYLPYAMDYTDKLYAQYLLEHPQSDVTVHYTMEELWKHQ